MRKFKNLRSIQEADAADYVKKPDDDEEATDYKPRSDGEAEFAAKHKGTTDKHPHADENQFKAVDVDHVDHKDAESDNVDGEKQPVKSGTKTFSNFRQATQTPLRRGDKRQGDFKAGSVKEEVELDEEDIIQKYRIEVSKLEAKKNKTSSEIDRLKKMKQKLRKIDEEVDKESVEEGTFSNLSRALKQLADPENDKAFPGAKKMFNRKHRADKSKEAKIRARRKFGKDDGDTAMGTAMKKAMRKEEVELDEAVKAGTIKLENGKSVKVTKEDAAAFNAVLKELNPDNRKRMESEMMKDEKSYKNMLTFAKRTM